MRLKRLQSSNLCLSVIIKLELIMQLRNKGVRKAHFDKLQADIEKELESNRTYENEYSIDVRLDVSPYSIMIGLGDIFNDIDANWDTECTSNICIKFDVWLQTTKEEHELEFIKEKIINHILNQSKTYAFDNVHVEIRNEGRRLIEDKNEQIDTAPRKFARIRTRGKGVQSQPKYNSGRPDRCNGDGISDKKGGHFKSELIQSLSKEIKNKYTNKKGMTFEGVQFTKPNPLPNPVQY